MVKPQKPSLGHLLTQQHLLLSTALSNVRETLQKVSTASHRQAAPGVPNCQESVVVLVPKVSGAPRQLRPAPIFAVVIRQGAIVHHRGDVGEHALRGGERCCFRSAGAFQLQTKSHLPLPGQEPEREQISARHSNRAMALPHRAEQRNQGSLFT